MSVILNYYHHVFHQMKQTESGSNKPTNHTIALH